MLQAELAVVEILQQWWIHRQEGNLDLAARELRLHQRGQAELQEVQAVWAERVVVDLQRDGRCLNRRLRRRSWWNGRGGWQLLVLAHHACWRGSQEAGARCVAAAAVGRCVEAAQVLVDRLLVPARTIGGAALRAGQRGRPLQPRGRGRVVLVLLAGDALSGEVVGSPEPEGLRGGRGEVRGRDGHREEVLAAVCAAEEGADGAADDLEGRLGRCRQASLLR
mmetsp:Transcript_94024/g.303718  ORF Transcript_94024/g.303718 Transcript_94024/m.303718 type:complete len:222 (+) Transcript_94024:995-1660(+)